MPLTSEVAVDPLPRNRSFYFRSHRHLRQSTLFLQDPARIPRSRTYTLLTWSTQTVTFAGNDRLSNPCTRNTGYSSNSNLEGEKGALEVWCFPKFTSLFGTAEQINACWERRESRVCVRVHGFKQEKSTRSSVAAGAEPTDWLTDWLRQSARTVTALASTHTGWHPLPPQPLVSSSIPTARASCLFASSSPHSSCERSSASHAPSVLPTFRDSQKLRFLFPCFELDTTTVCIHFVGYRMSRLATWLKIR